MSEGKDVSLSSESSDEEENEPVSDTMPSGSMEPDQTVAREMKAYTSTLRMKYRNKFAVSRKHPAVLRVKPEEYIALTLVKLDIGKDKLSERRTVMELLTRGQVNKASKLRTPLDMEDVAKMPDGSPARNVLVEGQPGIGKSVLAWELCRQWGNGEILQQYTIVLMVQTSAARVRRARSLFDLFYHDMKDVQEKVYEQVLSTGGEGVLVVIDGYDELSESQRSEDFVFNELLTQELLPLATVLVTTRSSAVVQLDSNFLNQIDQHIEVIGFNDERIDLYIASSCQKDVSLLADFRSYLKQHPFVASVMYIPLQCAIITELYTKYWRNEGFVPKTITELYSFLVLTLMIRFIKESGLPSRSVKKIDDLPPIVYHQLMKLCELAAEGIEHHEYAFDKVPCSTMGLMQEVDDLEMEQTPAEASFAFLHMTLQEYFAGVHWSKLQPGEFVQLINEPDLFPIDKLVRERIDLVNLDGHKYHWPVLLFMAGMTELKKIPEKVLTDLFDSVHVGYINFDAMRVFSSSFCQLLFEVQQPKTVSRILANRIFVPRCTHSLDWFFVGYCIAHSDNSAQWFIDVTEEKNIKMILSGIKYLPPSNENCGKIFGMNIRPSVVKLPSFQGFCAHTKELRFLCIYQMIEDVAGESFLHDIIESYQDLDEIMVECSFDKIEMCFRVLIKRSSLRAINLNFGIFYISFIRNIPPHGLFSIPVQESLSAYNYDHIFPCLKIGNIRNFVSILKILSKLSSATDLSKIRQLQVKLEFIQNLPITSLQNFYSVLQEVCLTQCLHLEMITIHTRSDAVDELAPILRCLHEVELSNLKLIAFQFDSELAMLAVGADPIQFNVSIDVDGIMAYPLLRLCLSKTSTIFPKLCSFMRHENVKMLQLTSFSGFPPIDQFIPVLEMIPVYYPNLETLSLSDQSDTSKQSDVEKWIEILVSVVRQISTLNCLMVIFGTQSTGIVIIKALTPRLRSNSMFETIQKAPALKVLNPVNPNFLAYVYTLTKDLNMRTIEVSEIAMAEDFFPSLQVIPTYFKELEALRIQSACNIGEEQMLILIADFWHEISSISILQIHFGSRDIYFSKSGKSGIHPLLRVSVPPDADFLENLFSLMGKRVITTLAVSFKYSPRRDCIPVLQQIPSYYSQLKTISIRIPSETKEDYSPLMNLIGHTSNSILDIGSQSVTLSTISTTRGSDSFLTFKNVNNASYLSQLLANRNLNITVMLLLNISYDEGWIPHLKKIPDCLACLEAVKITMEKSANHDANEERILSILHSLQRFQALEVVIKIGSQTVKYVKKDPACSNDVIGHSRYDYSHSPAGSSFYVAKLPEVEAVPVSVLWLPLLHISTSEKSFFLSRCISETKFVSIKSLEIIFKCRFDSIIVQMLRDILVFFPDLESLSITNMSFSEVEVWAKIFTSLIQLNHLSIKLATEYVVFQKSSRTEYSLERYPLLLFHSPKSSTDINQVLFHAKQVNIKTITLDCGLEEGQDWTSLLCSIPLHYLNLEVLKVNTQNETIDWVAILTSLHSLAHLNTLKLKVTKNLEIMLIKSNGIPQFFSKNTHGSLSHAVNQDLVNRKPFLFLDSTRHDVILPLLCMVEAGLATLQLKGNIKQCVQSVSQNTSQWSRLEVVHFISTDTQTNAQILQQVAILRECGLSSSLVISVDGDDYSKDSLLPLFYAYPLQTPFVPPVSLQTLVLIEKAVIAKELIQCISQKLYRIYVVNSCLPYSSEIEQLYQAILHPNRSVNLISFTRCLLSTTNWFQIFTAINHSTIKIVCLHQCNVGFEGALVISERQKVYQKFQLVMKALVLKEYWCSLKQ